jgi:hypothetical protein
MSEQTGQRDSVRLASLLKERLYVAIVGLSILLSLDAHGEPVSNREAAASLTLGVLASILASALADVIAKISTHQRQPRAHELLHVARSGAWALLVIVIPLTLFALSAVGVLSPERALQGSIWAIVASLGVITSASIHRTNVSLVAKCLLLAATVAFGVVVVGLQVLAHM